MILEESPGRKGTGRKEAGSRTDIKSSIQLAGSYHLSPSIIACPVLKRTRNLEVRIISNGDERNLPEKKFVCFLAYRTRSKLIRFGEGEERSWIFSPFLLQAPGNTLVTVDLTMELWGRGCLLSNQRGWGSKIEGKSPLLSVSVIPQPDPR